MVRTDYDYERSVSLLYQNDSHRGPGKVVQNLKLGLDKIGVSVHQLYDSRPWKYSGCLQFCMPEILTDYASKKNPILMGPNLFVLPTDNPSLCKLFDHFVVPSVWVKTMYERFDLMKDKHIHVWPVGIDTDEWSPVPKLSVDTKVEELDCFIYFKNRSEQDLAVAEAICKKFGLKYKVLRYGSYDESELKQLCTVSKFAVLLTGTESQGIAYMQILATDTPCYVFNNPVWRSEDGKVTASACSTPYFDERCGRITNDVNLNHFKDFLNDIDTFSPRQYILENHTLEKSAQKYYNFLRISHGEDPSK